MHSILQQLIRAFFADPLANLAQRKHFKSERIFRFSQLVLNVRYYAISTIALLLTPAFLMLAGFGWYSLAQRESSALLAFNLIFTTITACFTYKSVTFVRELYAQFSRNPTARNASPAHKTDAYHSSSPARAEKQFEQL